MADRATADLCDELGERVTVLQAPWRDFGGRTRFSGPARTLRVRGDNALVRAALEARGGGAVLVVDGGASVQSALVGGNLGALAEANGWAGVVVWGAVRDVAELGARAIAIRALASCPRKSAKVGAGERDVDVEIAGVTVRPGDWIAGDEDGVVVSRDALG